MTIFIKWRVIFETAKQPNKNVIANKISQINLACVWDQIKDTQHEYSPVRKFRLTYIYQALCPVIEKKTRIRDNKATYVGWDVVP